MICFGPIDIGAAETDPTSARLSAAAAIVLVNPCGTNCKLMERSRSDKATNNVMDVVSLGVGGARKRQLSRAARLRPSRLGLRRTRHPAIAVCRVPQPSRGG